jgi:hypothetical protein
MVPLDTCPVIQALQWQMNIFIRLQFNDSQAPFPRHRQNVNHGTVCGGKSRQLRTH